MNPITDRQREVLGFIQAATRATGLPPTRNEIREYFGWQSPNAAEQMVRALEAKGYLRVVAGASRGIVLTGARPAGGDPKLDLEVIKGRALDTVLAVLDRQCVKCTHDLEGQLRRHCEACCRKIVAELTLLRRQNARAKRARA